MPPLVSRKNVVRGVSVVGYACVLCTISKADETPAYVQHVQSTISAAVAGVSRPRVLEVGIGDAINLASYPRGTRLVGLDARLPSKQDQKLTSDRARDEYGVELFWVQGDVCKMPFDDGLFDSVVATKVLCSVSDPQQCVGEISRVLRKGGRFGYVEHVAADVGTLLEKSQLLLDPAQQALAGGCHLHRETDAMLRQSVSAGLFDEVETAERYVALLMWPIAQQAAGVLRR
ncbi:S-adenosyl-L-methionine-dependent methyltransferase [Pelagophyceae sp. CCMP2097]|nr:S-adenosyl-L-methionine-dependent methyltransferase [Pelagophyceae sp. CCMP2097]